MRRVQDVASRLEIVSYHRWADADDLFFTVHQIFARNVSVP